MYKRQNNYGPRQFAEKLIPKTIILAHNNKKIPIYGNGKNIRDWIYVEDHCDAVLSVLHHGKSGGSYNISANNEIDNITIVRKILEIMNKPENLIEFVEDRPGHDLRYSLRDSMYRSMMIQAGEQLEFSETRKTFADDLKYTIMWYIENEKWWDK